MGWKWQPVWSTWESTDKWQAGESPQCGHQAHSWWKSSWEDDKWTAWSTEETLPTPPEPPRVVYVKSGRSRPPKRVREEQKAYLAEQRANLIAELSALPRPPLVPTPPRGPPPPSVLATLLGKTAASDDESSKTVKDDGGAKAPGDASMSKQDDTVVATGEDQDQPIIVKESVVKVEQEEESLDEGCLARVKAYEGLFMGLKWIEEEQAGMRTSIIQEMLKDLSEPALVGLHGQWTEIQKGLEGGLKQAGELVCGLENAIKLKKTKTTEETASSSSKMTRKRVKTKAEGDA